MNELFTAADVIHRYTREAAIADGVLIDAGAKAAEARFTIPVALTSAAWAEAVTWDEKNHGMQDEDGRLWDVLFMASMAIRRSRGRHAEPSDRLPFNLYRVPNNPDALEPTELELVAHVGGGDDGEPVITIMLPHED